MIKTLYKKDTKIGKNGMFCHKKYKNQYKLDICIVNVIIFTFFVDFILLINRKINERYSKMV